MGIRTTHAARAALALALVGSAALAAHPAASSEGPAVDAIEIEREPNDDALLADGPIEREERYGGFVDDAGDVDWLEIPGEEADGQLLRVAAACRLRVVVSATTDTDPQPEPIVVDTAPGEIAALRLGSQDDPLHARPVLLRISAPAGSRGCEWRIALGEEVAMRAPTPPPPPPRVRVIRRTATTYSVRIDARLDPGLYRRRPVTIWVYGGAGSGRMLRGATPDGSGRIVRTITMPRIAQNRGWAYLTVAASRDFAGSVTSSTFRAPTERPRVPTRTFAELGGLRLRPATIYLGRSFCSPRFTGLGWRTAGERRATASGTVHVPQFGRRTDSCAAAAARSLRARARIVVSRPIACRGQMVFSRIVWTYAGRRNSYTATC